MIVYLFVFALNREYLFLPVKIEQRLVCINYIIFYFFVIIVVIATSFVFLLSLGVRGRRRLIIIF